MDVVRYLSIGWLTKVIRRPGFWLIFTLLVLITLLHHEEVLKYPAFLTQVTSNLGLTRHAFERILYLAPIVWAGFLFGWRGTVVTSLAALICMLPRAIVSPTPLDAIFETSAVFIVGNILAISFHALRREREYRIQLEVAKQELQSHIGVIEENEKRLTTINQISSTVSQSLELSQVLNSAVDSVGEVMQVDEVLIFLLDEEAGELALAAHLGVSEEFTRGVDRIRVGEGFNGRVAESGEPLFVEDASQDSRLTREVVSKNNVHSVLIIPMSSKGRVNGTLCLNMHRHRWFQQEEIELLTAIGNQIGIAIENAHLYQRQQEITEELRASEERYRELFENAYDAIWLHDLEGYVIAANRASVALTGYELEELSNMKAVDLLPEDSLAMVRSIEQRLIKGEVAGSIAEVKLARKDSTESFIQLATSLILSKGEPVAFQHIARDVTEQKRVQDNLHFYLQEVARAQEEERKRISRELHDETSQALVVLSRQLDTLASSGKGLSKDDSRLLEELRQQTNSIMQGVRRLSQDLRPAALDRLGLLPALEWLASNVAEYSGIATKVNILGTERRLPEEVELVLFRIAQEALRNVWRHSQATRAEITADFNESKVGVTISDNGKGFGLPKTIGDLARDGKLGLAGMQERAQLLGGNLTVQSEPGRGSSITVEIPA
jgi:PAS domain S-box-containing protein